MENAVTQHTENTGPRTDQPAVEHLSFQRDEQGQISVLVVLTVIPFVLLLAFIFNSAVQTSRKIQMQGAADAVAIASAVTVARGMNFIVLNNNAMAEILSLMIAVRCIRNTTRIMAFYADIRAATTCAAALACIGLCANINAQCLDWIRAAIRWHRANSLWSSIDTHVNNESNGIGWKVLKVLDDLNQISKTVFAGWTAIQARLYARKNGADLPPLYGLMIGGKSDHTFEVAGVSVPLPLPTFPLARGPEQAIAFRLEGCQYKITGLLNVLVSAYIAGIDPRRSATSLGLYQALRWANINHLKGDWGIIGTILNQVLRMLPGALRSVLGKLTSILGGFLGIELLGWRDDPPRPMLLSDTPTTPTTDEREIDENTRSNLRPYLQYLGVAFGRVPRGGRIGNTLFVNKPNALYQVQFTYAQADVYNPSKWDMWTQDWRAQLTRARIFDQKFNEALNRFLSAPALDWSLINTH